jgi:hypothetical protein
MELLGSSSKRFIETRYSSSMTRLLSMPVAHRQTPCYVVRKEPQSTQSSPIGAYATVSYPFMSNGIAKILLKRSTVQQHDMMVAHTVSFGEDAGDVCGMAAFAFCGSSPLELFASAGGSAA